MHGSAALRESKYILCIIQWWQHCCYSWKEEVVQRGHETFHQPVQQTAWAGICLAEGCIARPVPNVLQIRPWKVHIEYKGERICALLLSGLVSEGCRGMDAKKV